MLMKYHIVSKEGKYSVQGDEKISFATMLMTRSGITKMTANEMSKLTTIITRYSILRTQFKDANGKEIPVLLSNSTAKSSSKDSRKLCILVCISEYKRIRKFCIFLI